MSIELLKRSKRIDKAHLFKNSEFDTLKIVVRNKGDMLVYNNNNSTTDNYTVEKNIVSKITTIQKQNNYDDNNDNI